MKKKVISRDIVIIGGGAAGCFAAVTAMNENPEIKVTIVEKAHIERSGCLAAGINAINAYLTPGETPGSFLKYIKNDSNNLVRDDLVYSIGQKVNKVTHQVDKWGLPILKDEKGNYIARSSRSIRINGEGFKPLLAQKVRETGAEVLNKTIATNYLVEDNQVKGCFAIDIRNNIFYVIKAKAVICATGGAAGIYKPNNTGKARHKTWYPPFNAGAGYAMGIRAGAEMTTFEMRFVALRVKDVMAPTGSFAFSGARQINNKGEEYLKKYDNNNTAGRLHATIQEQKKGNGPCYLDLNHICREKGQELRESLLDMCPEIVLQWEEQGIKDDQIKVEIDGTEPYIVGGHCQAGYWVDINRKTTLEGLYAAGDVAGGAPKKYVTGAFVEGEIAAKNAVKDCNEKTDKISNVKNMIKKEYKRLNQYLIKNNGINPKTLEHRLQEIMDKFAGGKSTYYELEKNRLLKGKKYLQELKTEKLKLKAEDLHELMLTQEIINKIDVAQVLIEHLLYRKETRWPGYQTRIDYPERKEEWDKFVNSRFNVSSDEIEIIEREHRSLSDIINKTEEGER